MKQRSSREPLINESENVLIGRDRRGRALCRQDPPKYCRWKVREGAQLFSSAMERSVNPYGSATSYNNKFALALKSRRLPWAHLGVYDPFDDSAVILLDADSILSMIGFYNALEENRHRHSIILTLPPYFSSSYSDHKVAIEVEESTYAFYIYNGDYVRPTSSIVSNAICTALFVACRPMVTVQVRVRPYRWQAVRTLRSADRSHTRRRFRNRRQIGPLFDLPPQLTQYWRYQALSPSEAPKNERSKFSEFHVTSSVRLDPRVKFIGGGTAAKNNWRSEERSGLSDARPGVLSRDSAGASYFIVDVTEDSLDEWNILWNSGMITRGGETAHPFRDLVRGGSVSLARAGAEWGQTSESREEMLLAQENKETL
ncbi:hypothetical protein AAG570_006003 [Ranatra chinensis]|uniref:Uncharacterized protein n=1 Tax=Ranatra chinensis TaxID=642074 RepID=A0ABD0Y9P2_9HEMI